MCLKYQGRVNTTGKTYKVSDLKAKYTAGGTWFGGRPTRLTESLDLTLYMEEDRVTTTEELKFSFDSIRRVVFTGAPVPATLKDAFGELTPIRIEMRDGSMALLSQTLYVKLDSKGSRTTERKIRDYTFIADKTSDGSAITIDGFSGRAKTAGGTEGDFWIALGETRSIEF